METNKTESIKMVKRVKQEHKPLWARVKHRLSRRKRQVEIPLITTQDVSALLEETKDSQEDIEYFAS